MRNQIEVEILRVSPDGRLIEFLVNCPRRYHFTDVLIQVDGQEDQYSIKDAVCPEDSDVEFIQGAVAVKDLQVTEPSIYKITFQAERDHFHHDDEDCQMCQHYISTTAYISDVSDVYKCLEGDIDAFNDDCSRTDLLDKVIRNYLMLYAHQEALHLGDITEARRWFKMICNKFKQCRGKGPDAACGCALSKPKVVDGGRGNCGCGK